MAAGGPGGAGSHGRGAVRDRPGADLDRAAGVRRRWAPAERRAGSACSPSPCSGPRWPLPVLFVVLGAASARLRARGRPRPGLVLPARGRLRAGAYGVRPRLRASGWPCRRRWSSRSTFPGCRAAAASTTSSPAGSSLAATWGLGRWMRHRQAELGRAQLARPALEHDRDEATRAAVAYERARIARELHDLVAHSMAVIVLQAQAANRVAVDRPRGGPRAAGRHRDDRPRGAGRAAPAARRPRVEADADEPEPRPSLDQLDALVDQVRYTGLPVEVSVTGEPRALPPGVDLSAYRIVQEALTNTLKHAGRTTAEVGVALPAGRGRARRLRPRRGRAGDGRPPASATG